MNGLLRLLDKLKDALRPCRGLALAVACLCWPPAMAHAASGPAQAAFEAGQQALEAEQYQKAVAALQKAVTLDPSMGEAWTSLGRALADLERYPEAIKALQRGAQLLPNDAAAHFWLGYALVMSDDSSGAMPELMQATRLKPDEGFYFTILALAQKNMGAQVMAARTLQRAVQLDPKNPQPLWMLGTTLVELDDLEDAKKVLAALKPLDAKQAAELDQMIQSQLKGRAEAQAKDKSTGALGPDPATAQEAVARGRQFFDQDRYRDAAAMFLKAMAINPNLSDAYAGLGRAALAVNLYRDAGVALERAIALDPKNGEAYEFLGIDYEMQGRSMEASRTLIRLKSIDPQHAAQLESALSSVRKPDRPSH